MPSHERPPLHTHLSELVGWTLQRTSSIPKSHRFTFGQRLDNLTLDALLLCVRAIYSPRPRKAALLDELNLLLEQLRVLWRLVHEQRWISQQQLLFVIGRIDEAGRMTGGWLKQLGRGSE
jgi:hypothetical protein